MEDLSEIRDRVVRIETKIDTFIIQGVQDHEARLRQLEKWKYAIPASVLTAIASAVTTMVIALGR